MCSIPVPYLSLCSLGSMLTPNETSQTLDAIVKVDKDFDTDEFLKELQLEIVPTVLEVSNF